MIYIGAMGEKGMLKSQALTLQMRKSRYLCRM